MIHKHGLNNRILSLVLAVVMVLSMLPVTGLTAFAEDGGAAAESIVPDTSAPAVSGAGVTGGIFCGHHTEHTEDCGYQEETAGSPCTHEHGESCSQDTVSGNEVCSHEHDETCGYAEAKEGVPCGFICGECLPEDTDVSETEDTDNPDVTETEDTAQPEETAACTCGTDDDSIHATDCPRYAAPENPVCSCAEKCNADTLNVWCDVCGVDGADACTGKEDALTAFAANSTPTIDSWHIVANNTPIYIEAGTTTGCTVVYYYSGNDKIYLTSGEASGQDISGFKIYGGHEGTTTGIRTTSSITMTGGNVGSIVAGNKYGSDSNTATLMITGGTVDSILFGNEAASGGGNQNGKSTGLVTISIPTINRSDVFGNGIYKDGSTYIVSGNAEIPSDFTLTVGAGETLSVPPGASLTNNGTIVNNGTITVDGALIKTGTITGNGTINRNAAYITTGFPGELSVWVDDSAVTNFTTEYVDGKLYIYNVTGNIKATLNGITYSGTQTSGSSTELIANYAPATLNNGVYEIYNAEQLLWFARQVNSGEKTINGMLMADIDLANKDWKIICETELYYKAYGTDYGYAGVFDGNGYIIKNVTVKSSATMDASCGLFGTVSGTIRNLGVENFTFVDGGKDIRAGAIVGQLITANGKVSNCYVVNAAINPGAHVTGGIAGCVYEGTIENCYVVQSTITGTANRFGYIVGDSCADGNNGDGTDRPGTVKNCYTDGSVAYSTRTGSIADCVSNVPAETFASGEITYKLNGDQSSLVWYQTLTVSGYPQFSGDTVYKVGECNNISYNNENKGYTDHSFDSGGFCSKCDGYQPAVKNGSVYEISNAGQLFWFAQMVNGVSADGTKQNTSADARLMADIDLGGKTWYPIGLYQDPAVYDGGNVTAMYVGTFDGNFHTVSNFTAKGNGSQGLIGYADNAWVKNLGVINATVQGWNAGAVCGYDGDLENCFAVGCVITGYSTTNGSYGVRVSSVGGNASTVNVIKNCFAYNCTLKVDKSETIYAIHPVAGAFENRTANITSCYYGEIEANNNYTSTEGATEMTKTQFESGEVTFFLNGSTSEGELVWKQTIGTHEHPVFDGQIVYYDENAEPPYYNTPTETASVTITWTDMEFTYTDGVWNPETHSYEGAGWTAVEGAGVITVENNSTEKVDVSFTYSAAVSGISGTFGKDSMTLDVNGKDSTTFKPDGKPTTTLDKAELGTITVTVRKQEDNEGGGE